MRANCRKMANHNEPTLGLPTTYGKSMVSEADFEEMYDVRSDVVIIWPMKATNQPTCRLKISGYKWIDTRGTYDGEDGGKEKEVVGQYGRKVQPFVSSWRHR